MYHQVLVFWVYLDVSLCARSRVYLGVSLGARSRVYLGVSLGALGLFGCIIFIPSFCTQNEENCYKICCILL